MITIEFSTLTQFGLLIVGIIGVIVAIIGVVVNAMKK